MFAPSPNFETFCQNAIKPNSKNVQAQLLWKKCINDIDTPISAFLKLATQEPYAFLLESVQGGEKKGRYSVLGLRPDLIWRLCQTVTQGNTPYQAYAEHAQGMENIIAQRYSVSDLPPLESLRELQAKCALDIPPHLPPMLAGMFGYLGYDIVRENEYLPTRKPDPIGVPIAIMMRPTLVAVFDQISQEVILGTRITPLATQASLQEKRALYDKACQILQEAETTLQGISPPPPNIRQARVPVQITQNETRASYSAKVQKARDYIKAGDAFQIVLAQRFSAPCHVEPFSIYRALRRLNPSPFLYFLRMGTYSLVGSSPEILVRLRDNTVTIRPIAGTRPRAQTAKEDEKRAHELLTDEKERAEHLMLLDLGRNDVGRVAKAGTVQVTDTFGVEYYSHVMHIVSNVEGEVLPTHDALSTLLAGFPAGTVSGAPKVRAMEIIDELEDERRSFYAGGVGYLSADGDMDTAIALRTALIKDNVMHVYAGAGIVMDSDPDSEYEETKAKARALWQALEDAIAIESNLKNY